MAKPSKSAQSDRQKVIDDIRRRQRNAEKRQGRIIVIACVAVALLIIGAAAFSPIKTWVERQKYKGEALADIGAPASVCQDEITRDATGKGDHVDEDVTVDYEFAPPAFGSHWNLGNGKAPVSIDTRFYTKNDRPRLEALVHNSEHGFTILWYDQTAAKDSSMMATIKGIANNLDVNDTNNRYSFITAPWTKDDEGGKAFPKGQHIALTHWKQEPDSDKSIGIWQYCSEPSGAALATFMKKYPYTDAPEPIGGAVMS